MSAQGSAEKTKKNLAGPWIDSTYQATALVKASELGFIQTLDLRLDMWDSVKVVSA